jgi:hypothetical protein
MKVFAFTASVLVAFAASALAALPPGRIKHSVVCDLFEMGICHLSHVFARNGSKLLRGNKPIESTVSVPHD